MRTSLDGGASRIRRWIVSCAAVLATGVVPVAGAATAPPQGPASMPGAGAQAPAQAAPPLPLLLAAASAMALVVGRRRPR